MKNKEQKRTFAIGGYTVEESSWGRQQNCKQVQTAAKSGSASGKLTIKQHS
jgi:hypothetical protein